ncbi:MAG: serine/threonine protein kinase [Deltaproteobacteria bacterium]|jgi:serine/threonine protein kinase|nr:serine/threonine protein kinase [Deltaproteobacteria bacterium]
MTKKPRPFGKYYLLERINVGGMAEVFLAKSFGSDGFEKLVAIKRILPNIAEDEEFIKMFIDEAKISVKLNHPNIAQITDLNQEKGVYYIAMEYVHGKDARSIFEKCRSSRKPMSLAQACFIIMKVCEGLDYAHNKKDSNGNQIGIVHRDISPQNVLVSYEGDVKIIDFGIAKAAGKASKTQAGILKGKFGYMSPEQVRGLPLDRRSDIFSLGIVLYELLTGERLFVGESDFSTLEKVKNVEILPPSTYNTKIPEQLEQIVLKSLAKNVEERYQNASEMHDELQAFMYTSGEFYSRKDLSSWMKKIFKNDLQEAKANLEEYNKISMTPQMKSKINKGGKSFLDGPAPMIDKGAPAAASSTQQNEQSQGWWEEDEDIETELYDKPEDMLETEEKTEQRPVASESPNLQPGYNQQHAPPPPRKAQPSGRRPPVSGEPPINNPQYQQPAATASEAYNYNNQPELVSQYYSAKPKKSGKGLLIGITALLSVLVAGFLVWFFVINKPESEKVMLKVKVSPARGVNVQIADSNNKQIKVPGEPPLELELKPGKYKIILDKKGYKKVTEDIVLTANYILDKNLELDPEENVFKLHIVGEPKGATVWLNGKEYADKTPWKGMDIKAGTYKVEIGKDGKFYRFKEVYSKKMGESLKINYKLMPKKATIKVKVTPDKSRVCVVTSKDAEPTSGVCNYSHKGDLQFEPSPEKKYWLKVEKTDYETKTLEMDIKGKLAWGKNQNIQLNKKSGKAVVSNRYTPPSTNTNNRNTYTPPMTIMVKKVMNTRPAMTVHKPASRGSGTLRINSRPRSTVYIDGAKKGWTPNKIKLSSGRHKVTLINNAQGKRKTIYVTIKSGKSITKIIKF